MKNIKLLHYQKDIFNKALDIISRNKKVGLDIFTKGGKSYIAYALMEHLVNKGEVDNIIIVAPKAIIENLRDNKTYKLSGGEKKLASIATILSMKPDIIIMDEPSVALDPRNRRNLIRILKGLGGLKIIASHDLDFVMNTCERTILLDGGTVVADGRTEEILGNRELLEAHGL